MAIRRVLKHLFTPHWEVSKAFPDATITAIEHAIAAGERETSGEIRFVVESALPAAALLAGQSAEERALELFSDLRVWDTEHNNGVLIYVLLADRQVALLADRAVNACVGSAEWEAICHAMQLAFADGHFEAGSVCAIERVVDHLKAHFPAAGDSGNELADRPLVVSHGRVRRVAH